MHRGLGFSGTLGNSTLRTGVYDGKIAGLYDLEETLGRGHFAVVKLARHVFTGEKVAVKVIDKGKLDEISKAHLFQEVRCMKLVQHPNVVRLYEVIDTATKLYLILELGDGGDLYDYIMRHDAGLSEQLAKDYFRQIVRAISYCHQLHVVHRDLKPENVVFFQKLGVVKLTDFGFSNKFCPGQKLETSCGSLAYSAPEILLGDSYDAPAVDVWSLGVILYMLVCGQPPFQEANDSETLTMIMDCKYNIPQHVSKECKDLIARMLVRAPEKRATLAEIAAHPWLAVNNQESLADIHPLVSKEQLSEEDHNLIVQKIVNGNIATKDEIQECLDKNEYNHITATYFLLAERKLRSKRQEQINKTKRPEHLAVPHSSPAPTRDSSNAVPMPSLLSVPRTPGDVPQRSRKCSIVQEDEEEEDSCSGREELSAPHCSLNRRGSRSEGRLNLALQERLAESERRKLVSEKGDMAQNKVPLRVSQVIKKEDAQISAANTNHSEPWKLGKSASIPEANLTPSVQKEAGKRIFPNSDTTCTTIITDSSTISIPVVTTSALTCPPPTRYKTMPSPTKIKINENSPLQLNEIFEEGGIAENVHLPTRQFVSRSQNRTSYEQRRSKFHKNRTASCSSSDASDDDSENRKKRAHKLNSTTKPLPPRRDSHDDSSDSQEPGTGAGTGGNGGYVHSTTVTRNNSNSVQQSQETKGNNSNTNGRKNTDFPNVVFGKQRKTSRRRNGETRLRESQSLNRITEVQEDGIHSVIISTTVTGVQSVNVPPKIKGIGARLFQGFSKKTADDKKPEDKTHISRRDMKSLECDYVKSCILSKEEVCKKLLVDKNGTKKIRFLGKYFQVHKKLCIPIPGFFTKNRLYKAQSCSSLSRDRVSLGPESVIRCRQRAVSVVRHNLGSSDGDINQNMGNNGDKPQRKSSTVLHLNNVCNELTGICAVHLGQASKCCSFC